LLDGAYAEVSHVVGEETWTARTPFSVDITPARLLD
jgi:hypothetical protein